ncbi:hypothetical protein B0T16DRAFT_493987 [Cercophora newfieldiana]|uniref:Uncharacterized protein n=1 Tax=Cercophora newfieldiana TaxID=92897 RepID=A0AA39Y6W5_9PEZI|nr:hypothetical protein B0T16DRAFT_493987 [Cercophora newfieldiana]
MGVKTPIFNQANLIETLQSAEVPYMYIPYKEEQKPKKTTSTASTDSDAQSATSKDTTLAPSPVTKSTSNDSSISLLLPSVILPGPPSSFAYPERTSLRAPLIASLLPLFAEYDEFKALENAHWKNWVMMQHFMLQTQFQSSEVLSSCSSFFRAKMRYRWAKLKFGMSERKKLSKKLHKENLGMKSEALADRWLKELDDARKKMEPLDEVEKEVVKSKKNMTWLEKARDPSKKKQKETLHDLYRKELEGVWRDHRGW